MRKRLRALAATLVLALMTVPPAAAAPETSPAPVRIVFLHHSTGEVLWNAGVPEWFESYNAAHGTAYAIAERAFPQEKPYGWNNYPYDYWNIWVKHAGPRKYQDEPTLEMLTRRYDVIVFKHCFPGSDVGPDEGPADVASDEKSLQNYKLQYDALKRKMRRFPKTKFVVWTGPAQTRSQTDEGNARRAQSFNDWVRGTWDEKGDNIFVWDFRRLETEGGLYAKPEHVVKADDPHPAEAFAARTAPYFAQRVVDVIEGRGDSGDVTGR